jgi:hypothetical protein
MKILVSTKALGKLLSQIPENEFVQRVNLEGGKHAGDFHGNGVLTLITNTKTFELPVHILKFEASVKVQDRRWDWLNNLMNQVDEQPISLEIYEKVINIIFQY